VGAKVFVLSPASLGGVRGRLLRSRRAAFPTARRLRTPEGAPIGEVFSFLSALYFRGKLAYAQRFASGSPRQPAVLVIAPGFGLVAADWALTEDRLRRLHRIGVDLRRPSYRRPFAAHAAALAAGLGPEGRCVLLGSLATGKYLDLLAPVLGERLLVPRRFIGLGDMSRGSLLLRAALSGEELEYIGASQLPARRK
jgi:hypothetical protein